MNHPKLIFLISTIVSFAGNALAQDTSAHSSKNPPVFTPIDQEPGYPGGIPAFSKYISSSLKYPQVARLIGLTGRIFVSFVVDKDGTVTDVKPLDCLGAGCESEAIRVVSMSPNWTPGFFKGKAVRVAYTIPISFNLQGDYSNTTMKRLRNSDYGFAFYIKGKVYNLDEAEKQLGKSFDPSSISSVENYNNSEYIVPNKNGTYLIIMKDN